MDRFASNADALRGSEIGTGLYIDESAFEKKGEHSVGVARQWNGRLGKQDNCQVGVFGALGRGDRVSLIDARLYLPKEWTDDAARAEEAGVPRAQQSASNQARIGRTDCESFTGHRRALRVGGDGRRGRPLL